MNFSLDVKLALRLLVRYPLLTLVSLTSMAFGLAAGVTALEIRTQLTNPQLPFEEGARIVGLRNWDVQHNRAQRVSGLDFHAWREGLRRIETLGAAVVSDRNVTISGVTEPMTTAAMTASGFRLTRTSALLGRTLVDDDERLGAPAVAVISHAFWQRRLLGAADVIGRSIQLGDQQTTVVGVMPEGFGFPINQQVWTPLRLPDGEDPYAGGLLVFGRLAEGVTAKALQAELAGLAHRDTETATRAALRQEVVPYTHLALDPRDFRNGLNLANLFVLGLIIVIAANVALLMFARAASREREIGVRNALGASRRRIVVQLFVEALVVSGLSIASGLGAARYALRSLWRMWEADSGSQLAFWFSNHLSTSSVIGGALLTLLVAGIIGIWPAIKVTERGLASRLRAATTGYRFSGAWTAVIIAQVAVTVVFPATAFFFHRWVVAGQTGGVVANVHEYLAARVVMERPSATTIAELRRQLGARPGVRAVAVADALPGMYHQDARFEVEGDSAPPAYGSRVKVANVDADFFGALGAPALAGRVFTAADLAASRDVAVVNSSFVTRVLHGRNPIGRRIRRAALDDTASAGRWLEIIGLVRDLGMAGGEDGAGLYRPLPLDATTLRVALHASDSPTSLVAIVRTVAAAVDPTLRVYDVEPLAEVGADQWRESQYLSRVLSLLSSVALLLSLMAIYSVTAFTVTQRTKEIGTRVALGADHLRVIVAIAKRPLAQLGGGIGTGSVMVLLLFAAMFQGIPTVTEGGAIAAYAILMLVICLLACTVPARRALGVDPAQVLRNDA